VRWGRKSLFGHSKGVIHGSDIESIDEVVGVVFFFFFMVVGSVMGTVINGFLAWY